MTGQVWGEHFAATGAGLRLHSELAEFTEPGCNSEQSRQSEQKNQPYTHIQIFQLEQHYRPGIFSQISTHRLALPLPLLLWLADSSCRPCACCEIIFSYKTNHKINVIYPKHALQVTFISIALHTIQIVTKLYSEEYFTLKWNYKTDSSSPPFWLAEPRSKPL